MCTCGNHGSEIVSIVHNKDILELIFNIIIFGITNSFTHCIGMCGSIAMGQSAMRMIAIIKKPTTLEKIISCVAWEYYIGKAITYSLLTFIIMKIGNILRENSLYQIIKTFFLFSIICYLTFTILVVICKLHDKKIPKIKQLKNLNRIFNIRFHSIKYESFTRLLVGICLGFIPCGVVYVAIGMIVSSTTNSLIALFIAFVFGLTTIPGLFILSYSGNIFFYRYQKVLSIIYLLTALWNIRLLVRIL